MRLENRRFDQPSKRTKRLRACNGSRSNVSVNLTVELMSDHNILQTNKVNGQQKIALGRNKQ